MFIYNSMLAISIICFQLNLISYFSFKIIFRENSYNKKSWNILCKVTLELNFYFIIIQVLKIEVDLILK